MCLHSHPLRSRAFRNVFQYDVGGSVLILYEKSNTALGGGLTPHVVAAVVRFWPDPGYPPPVLVSFRALGGVNPPSAGSSLWFRKIGDFFFDASKRLGVQAFLNAIGPSLGPMLLNALPVSAHGAARACGGQPPPVFVVLVGLGGVNPVRALSSDNRPELQKRIRRNVFPHSRTRRK